MPDIFCQLVMCQYGINTPNRQLCSLETMIINLRTLYIYTSWLPLALYIVARIFLGSLDGWEQWAAGKIIMPSLILSLTFTVFGVILLLTKFNQVVTNRVFLFSILLSSSVMLWFLAKYVVLEIKMSF
jgi:hypothetical protein